MPCSPITSLVTIATPADTLAWSSGSFSSSSESDLISLTNKARANAGLKALKVDSTLTSVARWRSKDMITRDYFSHSIPGYGKVWDKLDAIDYCYTVAGENIGWNTYPDDLATAAIQQMFMNSPGHRANILGKAWDNIGIGAYKSSSGKKMWTVLFADKCGCDAPHRSRRPSPHRSRRPSPTPRPTPHPTAKPTPRPTSKPTNRPTARPTDKPKSQPTKAAVATPTPTPTPTPTLEPTPPIDLQEPTTDPTAHDRRRRPTNRPNRRPRWPATTRRGARASACGWWTRARRVDCSRPSSGASPASSSEADP